MRIASFVILLAACDQSWSGEPTWAVRTEAPSGRERLWRDTVEQVSTLWEMAVAPYGCPPPFRIADRGEEARPVRLVLREEWSEPDLIGATWSDRIEVKDGQKYPAVTLAHEFGHALGLNHHDPAFGESIMDAHDGFATIQECDARAAACAMGCGPCDTMREYE